MSVLLLTFSFTIMLLVDWMQRRWDIDYATP
jgi:hypothetical protein